MMDTEKAIGEVRGDDIYPCLLLGGIWHKVFFTVGC